MRTHTHNGPASARRRLRRHQAAGGTELGRQRHDHRRGRRAAQPRAHPHRARGGVLPARQHGGRARGAAHRHRRRSELRARAQPARAGLHGAARGRASRRRASSARCALAPTDAGHQPQLRPVPVPDQARAGRRSSTSCRRSAIRSMPRRGARTAPPGVCTLRTGKPKDAEQYLRARAAPASPTSARRCSTSARSATSRAR